MKPYANIQDYLTQVNTGQTTSHAATTHYLAQIEAHQSLHAVIETSPQACQAADRADDQTRLGEPGLLRGLPILIKDNINTTDGTVTSAGSVALSLNHAPTNAPLVDNLLTAGAVLLGKTNMTEFANYMVDYRTYQGMPNGYSSRGGQCVHPAESELGHYVNPSGSSTGSAVAVATGQALAAIGTETYGSIISPSQRLGIVGLKPTADSVNMTGVIPISRTLDIAGPMTTCVADAAIILGALQQRHYTLTSTVQMTVGVYGEAPDATASDYDHQVFAANTKLLAQLMSAGATRSSAVLPTVNEDMVFAIMRYEFKASLNAYLLDHAGSEAPHDLSAIIDHNRAHPDIALKYGQNNLEAANAIDGDWAKEATYLEAIAQRQAAITEVSAYFETHHIDVMVMANAHCGLAAITGFPSITVPIGVSTQGHPIGCCVVANRGQEQKLMDFAAAIEALLV